MRAPRLAGLGRRRSPHAVVAALLAIAALVIPVATAPTATAQDAATTAVTTVPAAPLTDSGYWAVADHMQQLLDSSWDEQLGQYRPGGGGTDPMVNSLMLLTHSVAAMQNHQGPARNDHRARLIAKALVSYPAFITTRPTNPRPPARRSTRPVGRTRWAASAASTWCSTPRWSTGSSTPGRRASSSACRSRPPTRSPKAIDTTARGSFWRYPTIRLNQINWYALMYAADAIRCPAIRRCYATTCAATARFSGVRGTAAAQPVRRRAALALQPARGARTRRSTSTRPRRATSSCRSALLCARTPPPGWRRFHALGSRGLLRVDAGARWRATGRTRATWTAGLPGSASSAGTGSEEARAHPGGADRHGVLRPAFAARSANSDGWAEEAVLDRGLRFYERAASGDAQAAAGRRFFQAMSATRSRRRR